MLVNILDTKAKRGHREKTVAVVKELAEMKPDLIFACRHALALGNGMIEHAIGAEPAIGDARGVRIDPPDLDAQPLRGTPARHIDRVNGNAACHHVPPMNAPPW